MGFTFKEFHIEQDHCAMKVGTDGVLLGACAAGGKRILDVGTGTGLIALMMAQRFPEAVVDAIDVDARAVGQARENIESSPFKERVRAYCARFQEFAKEGERPLYDVIVSNPPYFQNSLKNPDRLKAMARHTDTLSFYDLICHSLRLLSPVGTLSVIIPSDAKASLESEAVILGLSVSKCLYIRTKKNKRPLRCILELKQGSHTALVEEEVLMNEDGNRSEWYSHITKDFYIK
ncbi:tRNA1(Val) (adenine(37)-N6)-methyltransferase [Prevotella dentasini]|uniref:tRNA1(Val) (adenine(37)-N6)-methyltransferase n=1 Tax=Prevotella dentasini TaxID=589537 RepID=UPI000468ACD5|nr:methyltransferase [Prevotella dentasini]